MSFCCCGSTKSKKNIAERNRKVVDESRTSTFTTGTGDNNLPSAKWIKSYLQPSPDNTQHTQNSREESFSMVLSPPTPTPINVSPMKKDDLNFIKSFYLASTFTPSASRSKRVDTVMSPALSRTSAGDEASDRPAARNWSPLATAVKSYQKPAASVKRATSRQKGDKVGRNLFKGKSGRHHHDAMHSTNTDNYDKPRKRKDKEAFDDSLREVWRHHMPELKFSMP